MQGFSKLRAFVNESQFFLGAVAVSANIGIAGNNLHKPESVREVGTLKFFREKYNRRNVTPDKITKSFEGCEQFLLSVGKAYILEAALEFWGMQSLADVPSKHVPPAGIQHMSKERKSAYFHKHIGAFVDEFVMADPDKEEVTQHELLKKRSNLLHVIHDEHDYTKPPEVTQILITLQKNQRNQTE